MTPSLLVEWGLAICLVAGVVAGVMELARARRSRRTRDEILRGLREPTWKQRWKQ